MQSPLPTTRHPMGYKALTHHQGPYNSAPSQQHGHTATSQRPHSAQSSYSGRHGAYNPSPESPPRKLPPQGAGHAVSQQRAGGRAGTQPCPPRSPALLGLMLTGWKPAVRMEESATSASRPPFLRQYTSTPTSSSSTRHTATAISPTYSATSSAPWAAARGRASAPRGAAPCPHSPVPRCAPPPRGTHRGCRARRCSCGSPARRRGTPGPRCVARAPSTRGSASACTRSRTPTTCSTPTRLHPLWAQRGSAPRRHPPQHPFPCPGAGTDRRTHTRGVGGRDERGGHDAGCGGAQAVPRARRVPGQRVVQALFCTFWPSQKAPPLRGVGLVQVRLRFCQPRPQLVLQPDHCVHVDQPPFTGWRATRQRPPGRGGRRGTGTVTSGWHSGAGGRHGGAVP